MQVDKDNNGFKKFCPNFAHTLDFLCTIFYYCYRCSFSITVKCPVRIKRRSKHRKAWINKSHRKRKQPINAGRMGRSVDGQQKKPKKESVTLRSGTLFLMRACFRNADKHALTRYLLLFVISC